jgi:hypothetical protein
MKTFLFGVLVSLQSVACAGATDDRPMVNTAFTNGAAMPNLRAQLATQGPEFWMAKCRSGDGDICRLVGANFARGGTTAFGYFPQDDTRAAEFFSLGCQFGEPRSCGELGSALKEGRGIEKNPAKAVPLLTRSCSSTPSHHCYEAATIVMKTDEAGAVRLFKRGCGGGDQRACKMVQFFEGTGTFSDLDAPVGALGYLFGAPMSEAVTKCKSSGFKFLPSPKGGLCDGSQTEQGFAVNVESCDGRVCVVQLLSTVKGGGVTAMRQYNDLEAELMKRYGEASRRNRLMPQACASDQAFGECLDAGRVQMKAHWVWESKAGVILTLARHPNGLFGNVITYFSPLSSKASQGSGL